MGSTQVTGSKGTLTAEMKLDVLLKPGEVLGKKAIRNYILRTLNAMKPVTTDIKVKFDVGSTLDQLRSEMEKVNKEITKLTNTPLEERGNSGLAKLSDRKLKRLQTTYTAMQGLASQQIQLQDKTAKFGTKDFERAYGAFSRGYVEDHDAQGKKTGKRYRVTPDSIGRLTDVRDEKGQKYFTKESLNQIRAYNSELLHLRDSMKKVDAAYQNMVKGGDTTMGSPLLAKDVKAVSQEAKDVERKLLPLSKQKELDHDEALTTNARMNREARMRDKIQKSEAAAAEAAKRADERAEAREKRRAAANVKAEAQIGKDSAAAKRRIDLLNQEKKATADKRKEDLKAGKGVSALNRIRLKKPEGLADYENALVLLGRQAKKAEDQIAALGKPRKGTKEYEELKKLQDKLAAIKIEAKSTEKAVNSLIGGTPLRDVVRGNRRRDFEPLTKAEIKRRRRERNAVQAGGEAFRRSGGFGSVANIEKSQLGGAVKYHQAKIAQIQRVQSGLDRSTERGAKSFDRMGKALYNHTRDLDHAKARMQEFGGVTQQVSSLFRQFFRYALGYGALYQALAAVRALTAGVIDLDKALKGIQAVTQATDSEMRTMESSIKQVALATQFDTREIADAAQVLGQAGVIPEELPAALRATAMFASATGSAIELSADLVTSMRNVFTDLGDDTISNQLTQAINISKLTAADLKTVVSLSSQIAKSYRLTSDQYFAAVTTLRNAGLKPSTVATGLRQGLIEIFSPDSKTVKALKTRYKQIGEDLDIGTIRDKFFGFSLTDSPLVAALRELQRLGFTGGGRKVFQRAYDVRAENAISALITNIDELESASAKLTFGNAAMRAAETQMESLAHSFANMNAAISVFAHDLSGGAIDSLENFTDKITKAVQEMTELNLQLAASGKLGIVAQAAAAAAAGLTAGIVAPGGIPGKSVVAAAATYSSYKLLGAGREVDEGDAEAEAKTGMASIWDSIVKGLEAIWPTLLAVFGLEFANSMRKKGSPLFDSLWRSIGGRARSGRGLNQGGTGPRVASRNPARAARAVSGAGSVARNIGTGVIAFGSVQGAIDIVKKVFTWPGFKQIKTAGAALLRVFSVHPIFKFIGVMSLLLPLVMRFFESAADPDLKKQFEAAEKRRLRIKGKLKKRKDVQANSKLSNPEEGYFAAEGSEAASLEKIGEDISEYETTLNHYFGKNSKDINQLTENLIELSKTSPEAGSTLELEGLDALKNAIDSSEVSQTITNGVVHRLANDANRFLSQAEARREATLKYLNSLTEIGKELNDYDKAWLAAYRKVIRSNPANLALLQGLRTRDNPVERARAIQELLLKVTQSQNEFAEASAAAEEDTAEHLQARIESLEKMRERIVAATNSQELDAIFLEHGEQLAGNTAASIAYVQKQIELYEKQREKIEEERQRLEAELTADYLARTGPKKKVPNTGRPELTGLSSLKQDPEQVNAKLSDSEREKKEAQRDQNVQKGIAQDALLEDARKIERAQLSVVLEDLDTKALELAKKAAAAAEDFGAGGKPDYKESLTNIFPAIREGSGVEPTEKQKIRSQITGEGGFGTDIRAWEKFFRGLIDRETGEAPGLKPYQSAIGQFDVVRQQVTKREIDAAGVETFNPDRYRTIGETEDAIDEAKDKQDFTLLTTIKEKENLYHILHKLQTAEIKDKIADVKRSTILPESDPDKVAKQLIDLDREQIDLNQALATNLREATQAAAKKELTELKKSTQRKLAGYKKQLLIAVDSGNLAEADELDTKIIDIKKEILAAEVKHLRAMETDERDIQKHIADSEQDMLRLLSKPSTIRTYFSRSAARINRETPEAPYLAPGDSVKEGYLRQQGKVSSTTQRTSSRNLQIEALREKLLSVELQINRIEDRFALRKEELAQKYPEGIPKDVLEDEEFKKQEELQLFQEQIRKDEERVGELEGKNQDEVGFAEGSSTQLKKGFDLENVANKLDTSASSISNLGNVIQGDIVNGLDDVAGGFADALVAGESFTDGLRTGFADMFKQIASDMIKSGVMSFFSQMAIPAAVSFFSGASKGGVVGTEVKAKGGVVGKRVERKAKGGVVGKGRASGGIVGTGIEKKASGGVIYTPVEKKANGGVIYAPIERKAEGGVVGGESSSSSSQTATHSATASDARFASAVEKSATTHVEGGTHHSSESTSTDRSRDTRIERRATGGVVGSPASGASSPGVSISSAERSVSNTVVAGGEKATNTRSHLIAKSAISAAVERSTTEGADSTSRTWSSEKTGTVLDRVHTASNDRVEVKAMGGRVGGGMISGPGTGTSDSVSGVVTDGNGRVTRGIRVSDGEGIVTAKGMKGIGPGVLNFINRASVNTLNTVKRVFSSTQGYRTGGIPAPTRSTHSITSGIVNSMSMPQVRFAQGGMVKDAAKASGKMAMGGSKNSVEHNFQTNVNIEAGDDTGMSVDDLRRLDDGINLKVQEYIEDQMRPGGVLQSARGGR